MPTESDGPNAESQAVEVKPTNRLATVRRSGTMGSGLTSGSLQDLKNSHLLNNSTRLQGESSMATTRTTTTVPAASGGSLPTGSQSTGLKRMREIAEAKRRDRDQQSQQQLAYDCKLADASPATSTMQRLAHSSAGSSASNVSSSIAMQTSGSHHQIGPRISNIFSGSSGSLKGSGGGVGTSLLLAQNQHVPQANVQSFDMMFGAALTSGLPLGNGSGAVGSSVGPATSAASLRRSYHQQRTQSTSNLSNAPTTTTTYQQNNHQIRSNNSNQILNRMSRSQSNQPPDSRQASSLSLHREQTSRFFPSSFSASQHNNRDQHQNSTSGQPRATTETSATSQSKHLGFSPLLYITSPFQLYPLYSKGIQE